MRKLWRRIRRQDHIDDLVREMVMLRNIEDRLTDKLLAQYDREDELKAALLKAREIVLDLSGAASVRNAQVQLDQLAHDLFGTAKTRVLPQQVRYQKNRRDAMARGYDD